MEAKEIECQHPRCSNMFVPRRSNQKYCCMKCSKTAHNDSRYLRRKKPEQTSYTNKAAWDEVNAFIKRYKEETGKFLTYGKAVLLMEKRGAK